jgi:trans-aconitate methyltransferase
MCGAIFKVDVMSSIFDAYGKVAKEIDDEVLCSGRFSSQRTYIPSIVEDIAAKLGLAKTDSLFDIGCGTGMITSKLLKHVAKLYALDSDNVINKFKELYPQQSANITFFSGNFMTLPLCLNVDKILSYSVIHCLKNEAAVFAFINKTLTLIKPGGMLLLGDVPNISHKQRFLNTPFGKEFSKKFSSEPSLNPQETEKRDKILSGIAKFSTDFDDKLLLKIITNYRAEGYAAYILPETGEQNAFGYTREDILIKKYR